MDLARHQQATHLLSYLPGACVSAEVAFNSIKWVLCTLFYEC